MDRRTQIVDAALELAARFPEGTDVAGSWRAGIEASIPSIEHVNPV